jgi:general secretion pathway protein A
MYAQFFGLKQEPFSIAPDPRYLFMSDRHREALAHLLYGLNGGGGFVLLTGEIGAGKTTVCRCFLEQIPKRCNVAYIFNPKLTVTELLKTVCDEFHIPYPAQPAHGGAATVKDYLDPLNQFLLKTHAVGQNNVLIIDEAQNLSADVLEQLRLLTNLETNERKLLQIVLIGQPELRAMLARPELEQLAQRVIARFHLPALSEAETLQYIRHRLMVAGINRGLPFERAAMQRIHQRARGVPRRINLLCDRALLGAYALGRNRVDVAIVDKAASEVFDKGVPSAAAPSARPSRLKPAALLAAGVVLGGSAIGALMAWGGLGSRGEPTLASAPAAAASAALAAASGASAAGAGAGPAASSALSPQAAADGPANPGGSTADAALEPTAAAAKAEADATMAELDPGPQPLLPDAAAAWRELAPSWKLAVDGSGDPCLAAQRQRVRCFNTKGTLALVRQLDRPVILTLQGESERPVYALMTALGPQSATLRVGAVSQTVALRSLARIWHGEFATFWRTPPGYDGKAIAGDDGATARWLTRQLAKVEGEDAPKSRAEAPSLKARVAAFQLQQGLQPDGLAGPVTLMQINRAVGIDEPRLQALP